MDAFPELNWSAVARKAFEEKMNDLEFIKRDVSLWKANGSLTTKDVV